MHDAIQNVQIVNGYMPRCIKEKLLARDQTCIITILEKGLIIFDVPQCKMTTAQSSFYFHSVNHYPVLSAMLKANYVPDYARVLNCIVFFSKIILDIVVELVYLCINYLFIL